MRIRVTIDTEVELPEDVTEAARTMARLQGVSVTRMLEDEPNLWWAYVTGSEPDTLRVEDVN